MSDSLEWRLKQVEELSKANDHVLRGNGRPGLVTRVSNLEISVKYIMWYGRILMGLAVATLAAVISHYFTGK